MSFGEGDLRERVAELEREVTHWKNISCGLWCDLFAADSIVATTWRKACRELWEELERGER